NKFIEAAGIALASIMLHKMRSFFTLLGGVIGVAGVAAVATGVEGGNGYNKEKNGTLGTGGVSLQKASPTGLGGFQKVFEAFRKNPDLGPEDVRVLREQVSLAEQIGAQDGGSRQIKYGNIALDGVGVQGVTPNLILLSNVEVEQGRYFGEFDNENRREVCFL